MKRNTANEVTVQLAIGIPIQTAKGIWEIVKEVSVKKFTAQDKVDVFSLAKNNPVAAGSEFLSRIITKPKMTAKEVSERVTTADRDVIMCESYKHTRGTKVRWETECSNRNCGTKQTIVIDFEMMEVKLDDKDIFHCIDGEMLYTVEIEGVGQVVLKYPTAFDLQKIDKIARINELQAIYELYALCLRKWGSNEGYGSNNRFPPKFVIEQGDKGDHDTIDQLEKAVDDNTFGYEKQHYYRCNNCSRENRFAVDMMTFFFLNPLMK